jgi:hypothetical protein
LAARDHSAPECLINCLDLQFLGDCAFRNDIEQRPDRRRHANAINRLNVSAAQPRTMEPEHFRDRRHSAEARGHRHMQLRRHHVGELV